MYYHVKLGSSASKGVRSTQNWGAVGPRPLRCGRGWPLKYALPTCVILPNLVVLGQMVRALLSRSDW